MISSIRHWSILACLSIFGVATHMLPHDFGFTTVGVVGMLAAAYLPRSTALIPVLVTVFVVDALNGFYAVLAMSFVYLGHLAATLSAAPALKRVLPRTVFLAGVFNAVVFYLVSNITPMAMGYYPATIEGWVLCYTNGLPFLVRGILANLVFGTIVFGLIWIVREQYAHRFFATQRN